MDANCSRIDRLSDQERVEFNLKLRQGGFSDGLARKIAELHGSESERVIKAMYTAAIDALDTTAVNLPSVESVATHA